MLSADIICENEEGGSCEFTNPIGEQCIGGNAQELRFLYTTDSFCMGNNTQGSFLCVDEITANTPRPSSVYLKAFLGDRVYYKGIVNEGNVFSIVITDEESDSIDIEIRDVTEDFGAGETVLQTMTISVQCREEDSLVLFDTFGGLQLVGFRNEEEGLKTIYADITIRYSATNIGSRELILTGAVKSTPFAGTQSLIFPTDSITLGVPGYDAIFSEILTVNAAAIGDGTGLGFGLIVQGQDAVTSERCGDSDTYTLKTIDAASSP